MKIKRLARGRLAAVVLFTLAGMWRAAAGDLTAFELVKEGNRFVGEQAKDKVVQIRSEKSIGGLTPTIWHVVFYDKTAMLNAVEVKFGAGKMLDVKRPFRLLETVFGGDRPLERTQLNVDSDQALKIALKEPLLGRVKIVATELKLEGNADGPVWKVKIWAAKEHQPAEDVDIGVVTLSANDGKVVDGDLHIDRVD